jgi:hypothetical protein
LHDGDGAVLKNNFRAAMLAEIHHKIGAFRGCDLKAREWNRRRQ